jgi:hypothetical protein
MDDRVFEKEASLSNLLVFSAMILAAGIALACAARESGLHTTADKNVNLHCYAWGIGAHLTVSCTWCTATWHSFPVWTTRVSGMASQKYRERHRTK